MEMSDYVDWLLDNEDRMREEYNWWAIDEPECELCKYLQDCQPDKNYAQKCNHYQEQE